MNTVIAYLPINPNIAKKLNLPLKLPVLYEDLFSLQNDNAIPLEMVLRGLRAQMSVRLTQSQDEQESSRKYYATYYLYYLYEDIKVLLQKKDQEQLKTVFSEIEEFTAKNASLVPKRDNRYDFYMALFEKQKGLLGPAELRLRQIVSENPENLYYRFELAKLLEELNDHESALDMYDKVISIEPHFIPALFSTGDIFLKNGDYRESEKRYLACIEISKAFTPPYARLGVLYNEQQQYTKALRIFEKGLSISPDDAEMNYNYSFSLQRTGQFFSALQYLKTALVHLPEEITLLNEIGILSRKLGFFIDSLEFIERAFHKDPKNPSILWNLLWSSLFVSKETFLNYLNTVETQLIEAHFELERFKPFIDAEDARVIFNLSGFCSAILDSYEEIPADFKQRLCDISQEDIFPEELTVEENLSLLDWFADLVENFAKYPVELLKAATLFSVFIARSTRWMAFGFTFIELLLYTPRFDEHYEKALESLVITAQEYDIQFAQQLAAIDRDSFIDWNELSESQVPFNTLFDVLKWIINLLWIDPSKEEIGALGRDEAVFRLVHNVLDCYRK